MTFSEFLDIVKRNFFVPVVIAVYILAIILLILGETRDAWFVSLVITINFTIGIIQETRARIALKKLELMSAPRARRISETGEIEDILYTDLRADDEIMLESGDELPADVVLLSSSGLEVDESILTGESIPIGKDDGDTLLASSVVVAGSGRARVEAVGDDSQAGQMTKKLKKYTPSVTPLQKRINFVITLLTYLAIALSIAIGIVYALNGFGLVSTFKAITAGSVSLIPEGLLLASTLFLAYGSLHLVAAKVLPQQLSAIEAMALVSVLCTDKTGTLTENEIVFDSFTVFDESYESREMRHIIGVVAHEASGGNATGKAIAEGMAIPSQYKVIDVLAFSSMRKISAATVELDGVRRTMFMGAPEYISQIMGMTDSQEAKVSELTEQGKRVLLVAMSKRPLDDIKDFLDSPGQVALVGVLALRNDLREGVTKTVAFLQGNGVDVRVISGDSPSTVQYIAHQAGIYDTDRVVTGAELRELDDKEFYRTVYRSKIFARVEPDQKERIVSTLQSQNKFVGMVGDGVNDALALKQANLGVAMFSGANATRRVADIVLLDNSFNALPVGMKLGNRIMQAIELVASLFFHKVTYAIIVLVGTMALGLVYPFQPRHNTFMNVFLVTMPTIMWTLFPPLPRYRISPKDFWKDTLFSVLPLAILSGLTVTFSYWYLLQLSPDDLTGVSTTTVIIATYFGILMVFLVPMMIRATLNRAAVLARILYVLVASLVLFVSFGFGFTRDFFDFTAPSLTGFLPLTFLLVGVTTLQVILAKRAGRRVAKREIDALIE